MRMFLQLLHANFSAAVMVLGIVSNNDEVMPPHFFLQGLWVNAADKVLERVVKPWIEHEKRDYTPNKTMPAHKSKTAQKSQ